MTTDALTAGRKKIKPMNKTDLKDAFLDRPAKYQIILSKYKSEDVDDEFDLGWECDIFIEDEYIGGGTAPDQVGVYDLANEIIWDYENPSLW